MLIKTVEKIDLPNVMKLWNDGNVMKYVGFPNGLDTNLEKLESWLERVDANDDVKAYCIYDQSTYVGELFWNTQDIENVIIDIKLMPSSWGKGVGQYALSYLLNEVFQVHPSARCIVDPHRENTAAVRLYERLGFKRFNNGSDSDHLDLAITWETYKPSTSFLRSAISLRSITTEDLPMLWRLSAKEADYSWAHFNAPYFYEFEQLSYEDFIEKEAPFYLNKESVLGIFYNGALIGTWSYHWIHKMSRWLEFGMILNDDHFWGKGIGAYVSRKKAQDLFNTFEIDALAFTTWSGNIGMQRIGEKIGFEKTKDIKHVRYFEGNYYDSVGYSITRRDWDALYNNHTIRRINATDKKSEICREVLEDLPDWFGIPESTEAYINDVRSMIVFASFDDVGTGFIALNPITKDTLEIHVMGIKQSYHHQGIGRSLMRHAEMYARSHKYRILMVKTLDASHPSEAYAVSRHYYEACGMKQLLVDKEVWGPDNPCLYLVKSL